MTYCALAVIRDRVQSSAGQFPEYIADFIVRNGKKDTLQYGIHSIKKRLKLYFAVADIVVTSKISEGTVITIRISRQQENPDRKD